MKNAHFRRGLTVLSALTLLVAVACDDPAPLPEPGSVAGGTGPATSEMCIAPTGERAFAEPCNDMITMPGQGGGGGSGAGGGGGGTMSPDTPVSSPPSPVSPGAPAGPPVSSATPAPVPPPLDPDRKRVPGPIDELDVRIAESSPPQYFLDVTSGLPSGCAQFDHYTMDRSGDVITVKIWNTQPASDQVACTMIYGMLRHSIALGTDFEPGRTYTVHVNDVTKTFTAQ